MSDILAERFYPISGLIQVPATTPVLSPVTLTLKPLLPILVDFKIIFAPLTVGMQDVAFMARHGGGQIVPATGAQNSTALAPTGGWANIPNQCYLESGDLFIQLQGSGGYPLYFDFINANAAAVYVMVWARMAAKIPRLTMPITSDPLTQEEPGLENVGKPND